MTHKEEVRAHQVKYCNTVESLFQEDSIIQFKTPFTVYLSVTNTYDDSLVKDSYIVKELHDGKYLTGTTFYGDEFDDLSIYEVEDITEVAHILDEIQLGNFKILQNENN
jgi:hypothetical protein